MSALIGNGDINKKTKTNMKSTSNLKIPSKIEINIAATNTSNSIKKFKISGSIDASNHGGNMKMQHY